MTETKPFAISKRLVWEAYQRVKANKGAAGIDGQTLEHFDADLSASTSESCHPFQLKPATRTRAKLPPNRSVATLE